MTYCKIDYLEWDSWHKDLVKEKLLQDIQGKDNTTQQVRYEDLQHNKWGFRNIN